MDDLNYCDRFACDTFDCIVLCGQVILKFASVFYGQVKELLSLVCNLTSIAISNCDVTTL